jgi:GMP synthase (glutamine-hydrolysing)
MKHAIAIRHVAFEDLGTLAPLLRARGYTVQYLDAGVDALSRLDALAPDLLGARVYPGPAKEIGWKPLQLTAEGATSVLAPLDGTLTSMLHWHGDTFDLPEGALCLASTDLCRHQAFQWGRHALAFQCHPEADPARLERWFIGHACELSQAGIDIPALRADSATHGPTLARQAAQALGAWLDQLPTP